MYRLQVFDGDPAHNRWRDVDVIWDSECGWCYAFVTLSKPMASPTMEDAQSVAVKLAHDAQVQVRVLDLVQDNVVFDSAATSVSQL